MKPTIRQAGPPCSLILAFAFAVTPLIVSLNAAPEPSLWDPATDTSRLTDGDPSIVRVLLPIWRKHRVPAIAGATFTSRGLERAGTVGVRKLGASVAVTVADQWHLGSETKAMTAALAARLVEQRRLEWTNTVSEFFPGLADEFHPALKAVTILHLLSHRAGLADNLEWWAIARDGTVRDQREEVVRRAMTSPPRSPPGSEYHYSNVGYVVAGAIIEKITRQSWEDCMRAMLFEPLGMANAGFGGVGVPGQIEQPWAHPGGDAEPVNGPGADNPPVLGPAGTVHATLADWARFLIDQLRGGRSDPALLQADSYRRLFTPPFGGDYALGWLVLEDERGGGKVYTHTGCNTMNYAVAWLAPRRDFGVLVCINQGDDQAGKAADAATSALIQFHLAERPAP